MSAERQRRYRDKVRGDSPRKPAPCGTYAAFRRHERHGEPIDDACRVAYNVHQRQMYRQRSPRTPKDPAR